MKLTLSHRIERVQPSPTLAVSAKAAQLRAKGIDVIGLGTGEPDFDTPDHIKAAAIRAIEAGQTKYTAVDGTPVIKNAVINKFKRDNRLTYEPEQILVSTGGKQSFFNLALALLNPGDEVVIPAPYWVSYPDIIRLAEAVPIILKTSQASRFKISPEQLDAAITSKTRLVVLNSPSNPTGVAYTQEELQRLAEVLKKYSDIIIATDDMYEHILWPGRKFTNIVMSCPELYDRTVVLNGVSKAYSMTGWRIGYAGGPAPLIKAMKKLQSQSTTNPCSIAQAAAAEALNGSQSCVEIMVAAFKERHDFLVQALGDIAGIGVTEGDGTFYLFPDFSEIIARKGLQNDVEMAELLLSEANVALVPGSAFGAPGYLRLSFATSLALLERAVERIKKVLA